MIKYELIDSELTEWAEAKGITVQTRYRDDEVRSFNIWSVDNSIKAHVAVNRVDENGVELIIFDGRNKRKRLVGEIQSIVRLLDEAEALAKSWVTI